MSRLVNESIPLHDPEKVRSALGRTGKKMAMGLLVGAKNMQDVAAVEGRLVSEAERGEARLRLRIENMRGRLRERRNEVSDLVNAVDKLARKHERVVSRIRVKRTGKELAERTGSTLLTHARTIAAGVRDGHPPVERVVKCADHISDLRVSMDISAEKVLTVMSLGVHGIEIYDGRGGFLPIELDDMDVTISIATTPYGTTIEGNASSMDHDHSAYQYESSYYHPHVGSSGSICLGSAKDDLLDSIGRGAYGEAALTLLEFFRSYNARDPYCSLDNWGPNPHDNPRYCFECETDDCGCDYCNHCESFKTTHNGQCLPCTAGHTAVLTPLGRFAGVARWRLY